MKESRLAIILSFFALVGVMALSLLWIFGTIELTVFSLESFVGVIVALLGIIVTIILGWQIVNALEIRGKMKDLENRQDAMLGIIRGVNENVSNSVKLTSNLQAGMCYTNADQYYMKGQFVEAFAFYHAGLNQAIKAEQRDLMSRILFLQSLCDQIVNPPVFDFSMLRKQIEADSKSIRESEVYHQFSSNYDQTMMSFWSKMQSFGLQ